MRASASAASYTAGNAGLSRKLWQRGSGTGLSKVWLRSAFQKVRDDYKDEGGNYPGDLLVPPDVHGEYVPTDDYYDNPETADWSGRLRAALEAKPDLRDAFIKAACIDPL